MADKIEAKKTAHTKGGISDNARLREALQICIDSRDRIEEEQDKLRALITDDTPDIKRAYLEYQIELIEKQLTRAADCAEERLEYLNQLKTSDQWKAEEDKCKSDILHWFRQWSWSLDPRSDSPLSVTPFLPFEFQEESITWLDKLVYTERTDGVVEKSRDQGWTWITTAWSTYHWKYDSFFQALFGSKNEDAVDSIEEPDTILEKVRFQLRLLPHQMLPKGFDLKKHMGYMKIVNSESGSIISGEAPIPNFGRSGRYTVIFCDEHAAWPHSGRPQWTAASASSKSKVSGSTPQGTQTKQAELAKSGLPKLTLSWRLHPWKDDRWYDGQTLSMDAQEIAQEIDIDYEASQPGPVYKQWSEDYHVISWSQFASVFGVRHKPLDWFSAIYQDVGTSPEHPTATGWHTRPAERDARFKLEIDGQDYTYNLTDSAFQYRSMTVYDMEIVDIWERMEKLMTPMQELRSVRTFRNSHEAESERLSLNKHFTKKKYRIRVSAWTPGATRGISQMRNALKIIDEHKPHPFKPWLWGRPTFYIVVADDQLDKEQMVDDFGQARFREEMPQYHFPKQVIGEPVKAQKPYAFFNDQMDQSRIAAADGFVSAAPLLASEKREEALRPEIRLPAILSEENPDIQQAKIQTRDLQLKRMKAEEDRAKEKSRKMAVPRVKFKR